MSTSIYELLCQSYNLLNKCINLIAKRNAEQDRIVLTWLKTLKIMYDIFFEDVVNLKARCKK